MEAVPTFAAIRNAQSLFQEVSFDEKTFFYFGSCSVRYGLG